MQYYDVDSPHIKIGNSIYVEDKDVNYSAEAIKLNVCEFQMQLKAYIFNSPDTEL